MGLVIVEFMRVGTRFSLSSNPPPLPSSPVPSKDVFCRAPKQDVFLSFP